MNNLTQLKAVIWDVDGTMIDSEEMHRCAFNLAFAKHNIGWIWIEKLYAPLLKITGGLERIRYYNLAMTKNSDDTNSDDLIQMVYASKKDFYTSFLVSGSIHFRPGVKRILGELQAKDIALCIATATSGRNIDTLLETQLAGLNINWTTIVAGNDVERKKPAPDVYEKVLSLSGLAPEQCLAIEDSESGVAAAVAAGITTIAMRNSYTSDHDLSEAAVILTGLEYPEDPGPETGGKTVTGNHFCDWHRRGLR